MSRRSVNTAAKLDLSVKTSVYVMTNVLIVYYSYHGNTFEMAKHIAHGVTLAGSHFTLRTVPKVAPVTHPKESPVPTEGPAYVTSDLIQQCDALIIGSPTRFGQMAAPMKYFIDSLSQEWLNGSLESKPAGVFTSCASLHGGHESTLLSMMIPLLHLGAVIVGLPYSLPALSHTLSGGTPYGPSHHAGPNSNQPLTVDEITLCEAFGKRVAHISQGLKVK